MVFWQSPAHPQAGPPRRPAADRPGGRRGRAGDRRRRPRALRLHVRRPAGPHRPPRPGRAGTTRSASPGRLVAAVERKSLPDLVSSLTSGRLRFALGELATLPRAAVVVEDRYSQIFTLERCVPRRSPTAWPSCRSAGRRSRSCSARPASSPRNGPTATSPPRSAWAEDGDCRARSDRPRRRGRRRPAPPHRRRRRAPRSARGRARTGCTVPDRGRLRPEIHQAWRDAHDGSGEPPAADA